MRETRAFLASIGLPPGDLHELPDSQQRFPDGAEYRIEIPRLGLELLERSGYERVRSELGAPGLAVPVLATA